MNVMHMKSKDPDVKDEYDFSAGVRGKYAARYAEGTNIVILDDDVAEAFPDAESVNGALRAMAQIIREHGQSKRRRTRRGSSHPASPA
ncbi:MAG TPA: hypothetical protein VFY10_02730 [Dehalococcoidia bacterium]|nr:hypothetical protein [Dehalococcoidia bacterium]